MFDVMSSIGLLVFVWNFGMLNWGARAPRSVSGADGHYPPAESNAFVVSQSNDAAFLRPLRPLTAGRGPSPRVLRSFLPQLKMRSESRTFLTVFGNWRIF